VYGSSSAAKVMAFSTCVAISPSSARAMSSSIQRSVSSERAHPLEHAAHHRRRGGTGASHRRRQCRAVAVAAGSPIVRRVAPLLELDEHAAVHGGRDRGGQVQSPVV
jgi:hypothetical protein